ncbi:hypothetical protein LCM23_06155 [Cytobacillus kochii]|uniref:hypothetical protein n=1 Tax=Cytobacillus kochii TaxID=859143 RepID=UPI001CD212A9|nr:hypothetical protein [Cytobacillus kochii]MCA1025667.1 hypothetical protein [Cytobacillus kochii]
MAKSNNLKFSSVKQKAKEANETEVYEFEDGTTLTFYPTFSPSMIEDMFVDIQSVLQKVGDELDLNERTLQKYVLYNVIKYFTHLKKQLKATTLTGQINEMSSLIDSGYFEIIINEVFDQKEISKVFDFMSKFTAQFTLFEKIQKKYESELESLELKNRDVFEKLKASKQE